MVVVVFLVRRTWPSLRGVLDEALKVLDGVEELREDFVERWLANLGRVVAHQDEGFELGLAAE